MKKTFLLLSILAILTFGVVCVSCKKDKKDNNTEYYDDDDDDDDK